MVPHHSTRWCRNIAPFGAAIWHLWLEIVQPIGNVGCAADGYGDQTRTMSVEVRPVRSKRELSKFIKLPWRLYRDEPNWVAPLVMELKKRLDQRKNPFFEHAEAQYFLAYRDGRPIGRISAHIDRNFNEFQDNKWGLFGWFECEDDPEAVRALLDTAEGWLRERGRDRMVGPMDFTTNDEIGVLIAGHEHQPIILCPWHHSYYQRLFEQDAGMVKAMDLYM